jgi:hypothetical protein
LTMRTLLSFLLFTGFTTCLSAQFIVPDRPFHCPASETACKGFLDQEEGHSAAGHAFTINYVEYKDNGTRWKPRELDDAVAEVHQAIGEDRKGSALVVVYVHGWENNADEPSACQDVCRFKGILLPRLADTQAASGHPLKVVGIYLGWRGLTFTKEPLKHGITYWHRRDIARREGEAGIYDAIDAIEQAVHPYRKNYVLVLAGHSFGSRVLENAVDTRHHDGRQGSMLQYREQRKNFLTIRANRALNAEKQPLLLNPELPVDLVLYINAATSSRVTRQTLKDIRTLCKIGDDPLCNADPFYVAITSTADWATGILMPVANAILPSLPADRYWLVSAANSPSLHTDEVDKSCKEATDLLSFTLLPSKPDVQECIAALPGKTQVSGHQNHPFWIFNVGADVMNSHGDVWNQTVTELITNIITRHPKFQALSLAAQ